MCELELSITESQREVDLRNARLENGKSTRAPDWNWGLKPARFVEAMRKRGCELEGGASIPFTSEEGGNDEAESLDGRVG
jgi:hypothetical protein